MEISDIFNFKKHDGWAIRPSEVNDDFFIFCKISKSLGNFIANFDDIIEKELETRWFLNSRCWLVQSFRI